jgi:hypothetical protein
MIFIKYFCIWILRGKKYHFFVFSPYQVQINSYLHKPIKNQIIMGKIDQGILGGFSGKVGSVVGGSWKGINYMRVHTKPTNPNSDKQVNQRTKFTLVLSFLKPLTPFLRVGYKLFTAKQTAFNAAMSQVLLNAVIGEAPDSVIDFTSVQVSRGTLAPAQGAATNYASGEISISWTDNSNANIANATDKALVVVYNAIKGEAIYETAGSTRSAALQTISLPIEWIGDSVHVYLGFITEDGKNVANSVYVGAVEVLA